jgi:hypothetical protein
MGLIKVVDRVEPGRGSRFHSLAVPRSPVSYAGMPGPRLVTAIG